MESNNPIVEFGESNFRNRKLRFGIKQDDRRRHMYVIGKTGMGKTELLKNIAIQDIQSGRGLAFVDPHGDPVEELLDYVPKERIKDVVYINPFDLDYPIAFNVMEQVRFEDRHLVADGLMGVFKKIWVDAWSARMEYILNNTILALLESPDSTLLGINRMLADKEYRNKVIQNVTDPVVKAFWTQEFAKYTDRLASEATASIQNKVGQFVSSAIIRNMVGQAKSNLDMRKIMDEQKILLVNISKGRIGEDASRLLGALIITKLQLAAMSRVNIPEHERKDFTLMVDEFQNFATASFANILSEARKYRLSLVVAHQYVAQMEENVRDAVFGNVGTIITFRVGAEDAELLEKELAPEFMANDVVNLAKYNIYLKLMIDGVASRAFSASTMPPLPKQETNYREEIINESRRQFGTPREEIEKMIASWYGPLPMAEESRRQPRYEGGPRQYRPNYQSQNQNQYQGQNPIRREQNPVRREQNDYQGREPRREFTPARPTSGPSGVVSAPAGPSRQPVKPHVFPRVKQGSVSLGEILQKGAVDFKGRRIEPKPEKPKQKVEPDLEGLRDILKKSLDKG
ncbi:MAG: type IV secretion system DNA-binding domain-containing protein [bacterium]|nr:type IV secretion system DNA-binding domain-containing protein [bacterium]